MILLKIENIMRKSEILPLLLIATLGMLLRTYGLNWDQGYHLHPDERAITMIADRISLPKTLTLPFVPLSGFYFKSEIFRLRILTPICY